MMDLLFQTTSNVLLTLLRDEKFLGAVPGIISAFHSWGRNLSIHPHVHCLVTAGGLSESGDWLEAKKSFLLPVAVVRKLYRGRYLSSLIKLIEDGKITIPPDKDIHYYKTLVNKLGRVKWNIRIEEKYDNAKGVINYLARYSRGGPFHDRQIKHFDSKLVSFEYFSHALKKKQLMQTEPHRFMSMALEHVVPFRKQKYSFIRFI